MTVNTSTRALPLSELVPWYNAQERMPTVSQVCAHFGVSRSTAYARLIEASTAGLIKRRTVEDRWAR